MAKENSQLKQNGELPWLIFLALFAVTLYFEHVVFNQTFSSLAAYLNLGGLWIAAVIAGILIGRKCSLKVLTAVLFAGASALALLWLGTALQLPALDPSTQCPPTAPWTCRILNPNADYCNYWTCQLPVQVLLLGVMLGFVAPILTLWNQRVRKNYRNITELVPGFIVGTLILIGLGIMHFVAYYLPFYGIAALWLGFGYAVLREFKIVSGEAETHQSDRMIPQTGLQIQPESVLQDVILIAAFSVFGFSMIDSTSIRFEFLVEFGCGFGILFVVGLLFQKTISSVSESGLHHTLQCIDLCTFAGLITSLANSWFIVTTGGTLAADGGTSPIVVGFIFGNLCLQVVLATNKNPVRLDSEVKKSSRILANGIRFFTPSFVLVIILGISVTNINPDAEMVGIVLFAGLLLASAGIVMVFVHILQGEKKPEELN